jgi:CheY-like chemotaxis protein
MSKPVILLVDDELDLLQVLATAVTRGLPGYEVIGVASWDEAEECLDALGVRGASLALALVDHTLGGATGFEVLARVHADFPHAATFLFTGRAPACVEEHAAMTNTRVLWKPLRLRTLLGEFTEALS